MCISDVMRLMAPQTAEQLEDLILTLACRQTNEEREILMDAACLAYHKLVPMTRFRETMMLVNECMGD